MSRRLDRITDEAANWFVRARDPEFSGEDSREFASWLAGSAEHVREYLSVAAASHDMREAVDALEVERLVELARTSADDGNVLTLTGFELPGRGNERDSSVCVSDEIDSIPDGRRRNRFLTSALIAAALSAVVLGTLSYYSHRPEHYGTGVGEQVSFSLDDGSVVTLNAQSRLRVDYTDESRDILLSSGEAMFDVERDPDRPFRVITDRAVVRAVGTAFNVRHRGADTTVTVVEGIVDVAAPETESQAGQALRLPDAAGADDEFLAAGSTRMRITVGQQARIKNGEVAVFETDVRDATSWRDRRLVFDTWTLSDVVAEFNLYNDQRIVVDDPSLGARTISGTFRANDRESFLLFLREAGLAESVTADDGTIVLFVTKGVE